MNIDTLQRIIDAGLWHFTTPVALKDIMRSGVIAPNEGHRRSQHAMSAHSCCYRLSGVSLFDPLDAPKRNWLRRWIRIHKPVTIGIRLDRERLAQGLLSCAEARHRCRGGMILPGEVCHIGDIPMEACTGYLLLPAANPASYKFIKAPASIAALATIQRKVSRPKERHPSAMGWSMPAEWAPHQCCWMAWPTRRRWGPHFEGVCRTLAQVARVIARFEPVVMVARPAQIAEAASFCGRQVTVLEIPVNDLWMRDTGPTFLRNEQGESAGITWRFNAWGGKYTSYADDAALGGRVLAHLGVRHFEAPLVCEGGAICVDGEGTLLTTETVILNRNRNPGVNRNEAEAMLCAFTGARKVIWLPGSTADHVTNGHIDGIAAFARPGVVIAEVCDDPDDPEYTILQENLRALRLATGAKGRALEILTITRPPRNPAWSDDFAASYVNFYIANEAVIMPRFGDRRSDAAARQTIARAFPDRKVVSVRIDALADGGGGIHCVTQQQP